ncbi:MAG: hypothetical protein WCD80_06360 [Desulfobaccales bacterium]
MEITYSEDIVIKNETLLATLSVFCDKIYLPYPHAAQDVKAYILRTGSAQFPSMQEIVKEIDSDPQKAFIDNWNLQHAALFQEGVLQYLPPPINFLKPEYIKREHRLKDAGEYDSVRDNVIQRMNLMNLHTTGIYTVASLTEHLWRDDLPGYEFFEGSHYSSQITLSKEIFFIELPEILTDYRNILELRKLAQNAGISEFWAMIKEQTEYANAIPESYLARAEKVRKEFKKWCDDRWRFRGKSLAVIGGLVALAFVNSNYIPLGIIAGAGWIGELNRNWAQRKDKANKAFKFISRLHGKIRQLKNR